MRQHIIYFTNEEAFFTRNFGSVADAQAATGAAVEVFVPADSIRCGADRLRYRGLKLSRKKPSMTAYLRGFWQIAAVIWTYRDAIHSFITIIPLIAGGVIARMLGRRVVYFLTGMGTVFSSTNLKFRLLKRVFVIPIYRWIFASHNSRVVTQNFDDYEYVRTVLHVDRARLFSTPGCGVDENEFRFAEEEPSRYPPVVLVPARIIREKGVFEAAAASGVLNERGIDHEMWFSSEIDPSNPLSLTEGHVQDLAERYPSIRFIGMQPDMAALLREATVVCLPTYREGHPTAIAEAMAVGRAVVTTDTVGCRDAIDHGANGLLVPVRHVLPLANALERLLCNPSLRWSYRRAARCKFEREMKKSMVNEKTLAVFETLRHGVPRQQVLPRPSSF